MKKEEKTLYKDRYLQIVALLSLFPHAAHALFAFVDFLANPDLLFILESLFFHNIVFLDHTATRGVIVRVDHVLVPSGRIRERLIAIRVVTFVRFFFSTTNQQR
jgi:hypothetical protein